MYRLTIIAALFYCTCNCPPDDPAEDCRPGEHQVQECEQGQGGTFNHDTCECDVPQPSDCQPGEHQVQECEQGQGGTFNTETCECDVPSDCQPGPHQVQECEMGQGGTFNHETCECVTE